MSQMIIMLADMKPIQIKMQELLSLDKENPFNISQDRVATLAIPEVDKKRHSNNTRRQAGNNKENPNVNNNDGKVVLHIKDSTKISESGTTKDKQGLTGEEEPIC